MAALAVRHPLLQAVLVPTVVKTSVTSVLVLLRALAVLEENTEELAGLRHAGYTVLRHLLEELQDLGTLGVRVALVKLRLLP